MRFKSSIIFLIASSTFLICIISVWKIMSVLQGLNLTNLNFSENFFLGIFLTILFFMIGDKLKHSIKILLLSVIFTSLYFLINEIAPIWYYIGIFIISLFSLGSTFKS